MYNFGPNYGHSELSTIMNMKIDIGRKIQLENNVYDSMYVSRTLLMMCFNCERGIAKLTRYSPGKMHIRKWVVILHGLEQFGPKRSRSQKRNFTKMRPNGVESDKFETQRDRKNGNQWDLIVIKCGPNRT
jgi:hypothetical protein